jgi:hypothetical protein
VHRTSRLATDGSAMAGNAALRRALDEAITTEYPEIYREAIERLRREYAHSIAILPDGKGRTRRFNCFAYGLGVWEHPGFIRKVDDAGNSAILSSTIVRAMIDDGTLKSVGADMAQPGDVVVYFRKDNVTHVAVLVEGGTCRTKWGGDEVHAHGLWEVPAQYGGRVRYYRAPTAEAVLARISGPIER